MRLFKTKSGNVAKEIRISAGGKWRFCGNFAKNQTGRAKARAMRDVHAAKGRPVRLEAGYTSRNQAKKYGVPEDRVYLRLDAYIEKFRVVGVHATLQECEAAGRTPGPCNL